MTSDPGVAIRSFAKRIMNDWGTSLMMSYVPTCVPPVSIIRMKKSRFTREK